MYTQPLGSGWYVRTVLRAAGLALGMVLVAPDGTHSSEDVGCQIGNLSSQLVVLKASLPRARAMHIVKCLKIWIPNEEGTLAKSTSSFFKALKTSTE